MASSSSCTVSYAYKKPPHTYVVRKTVETCLRMVGRSSRCILRLQRRLSEAVPFHAPAESPVIYLTHSRVTCHDGSNGCLALPPWAGDDGAEMRQVPSRRVRGSTHPRSLGDLQATVQHARLPLHSRGRLARAATCTALRSSLVGLSSEHLRLQVPHTMKSIGQPFRKKLEHIDSNTRPCRAQPQSRSRRYPQV